jgi:predicted lipid-binding transport protein (Tim44 family)
MTMGASIVRVVLGVIGAGLLIGGLALAFLGGGFAGAFLGAFWMIASGSVLLIAVLVEVSRYRSQSAEASHSSPGPGGGEDMPPAAPFQRTEEVFVDPTSQRRMRVYQDPRTGERRYFAEG